MSFPVTLLRSLRLPASTIAQSPIAVRTLTRSAALSNGSLPRRIEFSHSRPSSLAPSLLSPRLALQNPYRLSRFKSTAAAPDAEPSPPPINSNSLAVEKEDAAQLDPAKETAFLKPKIQLGEVRRLMQLARPEYKVIGLALSLVSSFSRPCTPPLTFSSSSSSRPASHSLFPSLSVVLSSVSSLPVSPSRLLKFFVQRRISSLELVQRICRYLYPPPLLFSPSSSLSVPPPIWGEQSSCESADNVSSLDSERQLTPTFCVKSVSLSLRSRHSAHERSSRISDGTIYKAPSFLPRLLPLLPSPVLPLRLDPPPPSFPWRKILE